MIYTLTLNPAIDTTITVDTLESMRVLRTRSDVGGKGLNVSKTLQALGVQSLAIGVIAGHKGRIIQKHLDAIKLNHKVFNIPGETRENKKIIAQSTHAMREENERGPQVPDTLLDELKVYLDHTLEKGDVLILSGSLPPGLPADTYRQIIQRVKHQGVQTFLDASNEALKHGIKAGPSGIKPNHHEWAYLWDRPFNPDTWQTQLPTLHNQGIDTIFVTCGKDGAYASNGSKKMMAPPLDLNVQSTVGAGDAFVAGWAMRQNQPLEEQLAWASALASATTQTPGTTPPEKNVVQSMFTSIYPTIKELP